MSEDPTSADAVARAMGLGGDAPAGGTVRPARAATGLEAPRGVAWWRRAPARPIVVAAALLFAGYVFAWGDVEKDSRIVAALAGGLVFFLCTLIAGSLWWAFRAVTGKSRPFGRTVFNYGLVGAITVFGILGADEISG